MWIYNSFKRFHRLQEGLVGYVHDVLKSSTETKVYFHRLRAMENEKFGKTSRGKCGNKFYCLDRVEGMTTEAFNFTVSCVNRVRFSWKIFNSTAFTFVFDFTLSLLRIQRFVNSRLIPSSPNCLQVSRSRFKSGF